MEATEFLLFVVPTDLGVLLRSLKAIAVRRGGGEAIASRLEAIPFRLEATAVRRGGDS